MLNIVLFGQDFVINTISFAAAACAFSCITTDNYSVYNSATTKSLAHILRLFGSYLASLQINSLNWFQLFFIANKLILYLTIQLYLLILYLIILNCNTINVYRDIGEALQQVVGIESDDCHCVNTTYPKQWIYNLHGYSSDTYIIHAGKNGDTRTMEESDMDVNSIIKIIIMHYELLNVLFDSYGMLQILIYNNSLSSCVVKDGFMNSSSIVIKKNIDITLQLQNIMDYNYLRNDWLNLFGLLKRDCICILIVLTQLLNTEAKRYIIIIGKYNLICFKCVIVFDVAGDKQIVLLQKMTKKINEESLIWVCKKVTKSG